MNSRWMAMGLLGLAIAAAGTAGYLLGTDTRAEAPTAALEEAVTGQGSAEVLAQAEVAPAPAERATARQRGGLGDGISVKGLWHIQVKNPDGSLAREVRFENEFVGAQTLANILVGTTAAAGWMIRLQTAPGGTLCVTGSDVWRECIIQWKERILFDFYPAQDDPLLQWKMPGGQLPASPGAPMVLQLKGAAEITAPDPDPLSGVIAAALTCGHAQFLGPEPNEGCSEPPEESEWSRHTFAAGEEIPVLQGQFVHVAVEYRFTPTATP